MCFKNHTRFCVFSFPNSGACVEIENHKIIHVNQTTDTALVHTSCMNNERVVPQFEEVTHSSQIFHRFFPFYLGILEVCAKVRDCSILCLLFPDLITQRR